jgi:RND family efflux transporter MFP subunit
MLTDMHKFPAFARVVALLAAGLGALAQTAPGAARAETVTVQQVQVDDKKAVYATVETADVVAARARIGGTVARLVVDEGSSVREGARIAVVVDDKLRLQLQSLQAQIDSAASQRKLAATGLERAKSLFKSGTVPQKRLDEAQAQFDAADKALASVRAEEAVVREQQAEGAVRAPASGRVIKVSVTEGAVVLPGETVATIAAKAYILRLALPERHARFIKPGDKVTVLDGPAPREGRIRQVYPEMKQGRVIADVDVAGLGDYFVGERVRVLIKTGTRTTFAVPADYLFTRFGVSFVKLQDGGEAVVQPGRPLDDGRVEVLSGLKAGDVLVKP